MRQRVIQRGLTSIEMIIATAILLVVIASIFALYNRMIVVSHNTVQKTQAHFLVEEGLEAMRTIRDTSFDSFFALLRDTDYGLAFDGTNWATTTPGTLVDGVFDRRVVVSDVYRDAIGHIALSGTLDDGTVQVSVAVSWNNAGEVFTEESSAYFSRLYE